MLHYDTAKLHKILKDFYTLTKIKIVLIDNEFNELLAYPSERFEFCDRIRKNLTNNANCVNCDRDACIRCAKQKEVILYRCYTGLMEAIVPIYDQKGVIGYIMFGQILASEDSDEIKKQLYKKYTEQSYPGIQEAIERIPIYSMKELNSAATLLQALTALVISKRWVAPDKTEFIRRLDQYIENNINRPITVDEICEELGVGRTYLYKMAKKYIGESKIAEYIRKRRIEHSKKLLVDTNDSIADIASAVGFTDYVHFARTFKQNCGVSAKNYRKMNK